MSVVKRLRGLDWPTLLAELVLIFVGITAALWFDNWNAARDSARLEEEVLTEISAALVADTVDLNINLASSARTLSSIDTILLYFDNGWPYADELADHFRQAAEHTGFIQHKGAYEFLKSAGVGLIRNQTLRANISRHFEHEVRYLHEVEDIFVTRTWEAVVRPQMTEKFSYQLFFGPAVPHDYQALSGDPEFRSALTTIREAIIWKDRRTRAVLESAEELIEGIRVELGRGT
jgi:hypothetical protein